MKKISTLPSLKFIRKRASVPASNGSMTVEAALTIPLFLFAVLSLIFLLEIQAIRFSVYAAAQSAAKTAAVQAAVVPVVNPFQFQSDIVNAIGAERLDRSIVEGGSSGIHCGTTYFSEKDGIIHVHVRYKVRLPFPGYTGLGTNIKQEFEVKAWTGYEDAGIEDDDGEIVYITDTGGVYHSDYHCSYLQLSIQYVPVGEVSGIRNENGEKYHACEQCVHGMAMSGVYVTEYGNKYHNSLNCSGLKRTIHAVKKSEVSGMGGCSKCTGSD